MLFIILILQSCGSVKLHDTRACAIAGVVEAGADCVTSLSGKKYQLTFDELIDLLQPNEERGGAIIIPVEDFIELKNTIEIACKKLRCKKETKEKYLKNIDYLLKQNTFVNYY